MSEIRSAKEIAAERIKDVGEITEEDRLRWKFVPAGEKLAGRYMTERLDLETELAAFTSKELPFVRRGLTQALLSNIDLPRNETAIKRNDKVMDAIMETKDDKESVAGALGEIQRIFEHYTQAGEGQRAQAKQALKGKFEQSLRQAMRAQGKEFTGQMNVEQYPQFQEEWRKAQTQLELQYVTSIDEIKKFLATVE